MLRQLCLPDSKLCQLQQLLSDTLLKQSITKHELQSLVGKLNFAARVVFRGQTFLRQLIDVTNALSRPHHYVRINTPLRADLSWWASFVTKLSLLIPPQSLGKNSLPMPVPSEVEGSFGEIGFTPTGLLIIPTSGRVYQSQRNLYGFTRVTPLELLLVGQVDCCPHG